MKTVFIQISTVVILVIVVVLTFYSDAGAVHKGAGGLTCGNCHTMHNSQGSTTGNDGNAPLGGNVGGSLVLLRGPVTSRDQIHKLCLQCHASNGSQAAVSHAPQNVAAPKVYSSGTWNDADAFNAIGSGGNFSTELTAAWDTATQPALGYGHSLGATTVVPPGGDQALAYLTCTSCHDPHGTNSTASTTINIFRNLKVNATDAGANSGVTFYPGPGYNSSGGSYPGYTREAFIHKSYVGGVNGAYFGGNETDTAGQVIWPVYRGNLTANPSADKINSNVYGAGADVRTDNSQGITISLWCAQCHDKWHEKNAAANRSLLLDETWERHWRRHTAKAYMPHKAAPGCAGNCHETVPHTPNAMDRANYSAALIQAGKGLPVTSSYTNDWNFSPDGVYYLPFEPPCAVPGDASCMWQDYSQVICLTCHFAHGGPYRDGLRWDYIEASSVAQGTQTGNPIASTKGCQLCHNR